MIPARLSFIFKPATVLIGATKIIFWHHFRIWLMDYKRRKKKKKKQGSDARRRDSLQVIDNKRYWERAGQFLPDPSPSLMSLLTAQELNRSSFPLVSDHYTPSPPLSQHFALSEISVLMLV